MKTLSLGSTGPDVELLQLGLQRGRWLRAAPDGIFGKHTQTAVYSFQNDSDLNVNGIVDAQSWRALSPFLTGYDTVKIAGGDTLYDLSKRFSTSLDAILIANPGIEPQDLRIGQMIIIPYGFDVVPTNISFTSNVLAYSVEGLSVRYPFLGSESIGSSVLGRDLYMLSIGSGPIQVLYNASHHANEWITTPIVTHFLEEYAKAYAFGGDIAGEDAAALFSRTRLSVEPMVNPDGVDLVTGLITQGDEGFAQAEEIAKAFPAIPFPDGWKANIEGTDPNLNYPAGWENAKEIKYAQGFTKPAPRDFVGTAPLSAPESRALYDYTKENNFALTESWHTQGNVIYWKFLDYDVPGSLEIAKKFSDVSGYAVELTPSESGYAGYKDWFIQEYLRPGYTLEAGSGENPLPISDFDSIYKAAEGILALGLREAPQPVSET